MDMHPDMHQDPLAAAGQVADVVDVAMQDGAADGAVDGMAIDGMSNGGLPVHAMGSPEPPAPAFAPAFTSAFANREPEPMGGPPSYVQESLSQSQGVPIEALLGHHVPVHALVPQELHHDLPELPQENRELPQESHELPQENHELPVYGQESHLDNDQAMLEVDDSMSSTMTASTVGPLPELEKSNSFPTDNHRPQTSYSDTTYHNHNFSNPSDVPYGSRFITSSDADTPPRHSYYNGAKEPQMGQPYSRPSSTMDYRAQSESGGSRYQDQNQRTSLPPQEPVAKNSSVVIKVGMVGDAQIGKTSLMVKYVEGSWDEDYIQTLGVNFMEKTISIRNTEITFSIWDLGGQREFVNMLPLVCNDAVAILFMFDLTRKSTLNSIKEWYRQGRGFNKTAIPFLVGTKYDHFVNFPREEQEEISNQAKRFAKAMKASLIFSSTSHSINVQKIFKIVLSKAFDLKCTIPEIENIGEPLLLYQNV